MPATLDIREVPEGLILRVGKSRSIVKAILGLVFGTGFIVYFLRNTKESMVVTVLVCSFFIYAIVNGVIGELCGTSVTLTVTNLDLISEGHAPDGYKPSSIPRASIYQLEFREPQNVGEGSPDPSGLYVEYEGLLLSPQTCVLPHIDQTQTHQAIEAILRRFPDTESLAPSRVGRTSDLVSLNLNRRSMRAGGTASTRNG
ncbi:hypothetical protein JAO29_10480 [Edaphobacter sp. HDX4]|uniref:hypothetical protein n=1 Tax=Edaphobacter sp. HDX4 TaxID=2794064 RepID=UPI002FE5C5C3